jgi:phosphatidylglycerol lysyltransferase
VLAVLALALETLRHRPFRVRDVLRAAHQISWEQIALAAALTVLAYGVLVGYDALSLRYAGRRLQLRRTALASFIAYGLSHTLGFALLTGGSVRARLWSGWGLGAEEIAQAIAFVSVMFLAGIATIGGLVLVLEPAPLVATLGVAEGLVRGVGALLLGAVAAYLVWCAVRRERSLRIGPWEFRAPRVGLALTQVTVAAGDWVVAASVFAVLLPSHPELSFPAIVGVFLVAQFAGLVSHVPGGLGVFESLMVVLLAPAVPATEVLGTLVVYRAVFYLGPFAAALLLLAIREVRTYRQALASAAGTVTRSVARFGAPLVPAFFGATVFLAGALLLVSGVTPGVHSRLRWLDDLLPLGVIELSHLAASVAGAGLIVLARGLMRRLDAAWVATVALLLVGIAGSLLKGLDWEEAAALSLVLVTLLPARRVFHRRAALLAEAWSPGWVAALVAVAGTMVWLGLVTYRHVPYTADLWWGFVLRGDAPRFLRATAGVLVVFGVAGLARLLRPARRRPAPARLPDLERAKAIIAATPEARANIALMGDKSLLFSESGRSFLMYGVSGRSWVALGDPVGPAGEHPELVWRFRELADRQGGWTVFYQVTTAHLPLYLDLGLNLLKLGEEAVVVLDGFTLEGGRRRGLRRTSSQMERAGVAFEVLPIPAVPSVLGELREISDAWLASKATREKGFSLGRFDPAYLRHFPVAVLQHGGRIVAFANLWLGAGHSEVSVDLMRFRPEAPHGAMEYLFTRLLLWAREAGYRSFVLGMAPLSGLERRPLAPLWTRVGGLLYEHGEHFYNFQGLRAYKEKFDPEWHPRYLACPGGLALPRVISNVVALVSGGLRGVVVR